MTLHTKLCDLLGVEHPIMLAGMGGVSYAELVAAVSNAGGYGVLGMAGRSPDFIRDEMRKVKSLTGKPFGVDLLAASPDSLTASVEIIIEEGASSFVAGLGVPMPIMERLKKGGLKVMVVCGAVKHAVKAEQAGCDAVICQGGEGGGHTGLVGTMPPEEAHAGQMYRDVIVGASDEDTVRTRSYSGKPMRVKKNPYVEDWERRPADIQPFPQQAILSSRAGVMGGIGGQIEGLDADSSAFAMGQSAGGVHDVAPAGEIVRRIMAEAEAAIDRVTSLTVDLKQGA